MKKKLILIACVVLVFCVGFVYFGVYTSINIGKSTKFSKAEIQAAVDCVIKNFKTNFQRCHLEKIWYNEGKSDAEIGAYMNSGHGSINGVKEENVIVLFSNFYVGPGADASLNKYSIYSHWSWTLIRDSKTGNWRIDDAGY